jgi:hypothetical protein
MGSHFERRNCVATGLQTEVSMVIIWSKRDEVDNNAYYRGKNFEIHSSGTTAVAVVTSLR